MTYAKSLLFPFPHLTILCFSRTFNGCQGYDRWELRLYDQKYLQVSLNYLTFSTQSWLRMNRHKLRPSSTAKIIFGRNVSWVFLTIDMQMLDFYCRGLRAAKVWSEIWPSTKANIIVTCSVFRASQKVFSSLFVYQMLFNSVAQFWLMILNFWFHSVLQRKSSF